MLDFLVWLIVTLDAPWVVHTLIGKFLIGLVSRENIVYLYADLDTLAKRTDAPRRFIAKELAVYGVLAKYLARCFINTGRIEPVRVVAEVLRCLERRGH